MFALLLVACGVPESGDSASAVDVSVAPVYLSRSWDYYTLSGEGPGENSPNSQDLMDPYGSVYLVNDGPDPVEVVALATSTRNDVANARASQSVDTWLDVSPDGDVGFTLQPGEQSQVDFWALGHCLTTTGTDGDPVGKALERGTHTFDLTITMDGIDTTVRADVILESAEN